MLLSQQLLFFINHYSPEPSYTHLQTCLQKFQTLFGIEPSTCGSPFNLYRGSSMGAPPTLKNKQPETARCQQFLERSCLYLCQRGFRADLCKQPKCWTKWPVVLFYLSPVLPCQTPYLFLIPLSKLLRPLYWKSENMEAPSTSLWHSARVVTSSLAVWTSLGADDAFVPQIVLHSTLLIHVVMFTLSTLSSVRNHVLKSFEQNCPCVESTEW